MLKSLVLIVYSPGLASECSCWDRPVVRHQVMLDLRPTPAGTVLEPGFISYGAQISHSRRGGYPAGLLKTEREVLPFMLSAPGGLDMLGTGIISYHAIVPHIRLGSVCEFILRWGWRIMFDFLLAQCAW